MLIKCYNYANEEFYIHDKHKEEDIFIIDVMVVSGDEIITIYWNDNTNQILILAMTVELQASMMASI